MPIEPSHSAPHRAVDRTEHGWPCLADRLAFARGFLAQPRQIASLVESSRFLERHVVRAADASNVHTAVELGPGTGGTTRALLAALPSDARLMAVEQSPTFRARLLERLDDARLVVPSGSAEQLTELLQASRLPAPDLVVSGIPFSTLPPDAGRRTARAIADCLRPGGRFVAYQVRAHVADLIAPYLGVPSVAWQWLNVPPLRVFCWVKPAAPA